MSSPRFRIDGSESYVLHRYPYRETSLIVELFSRESGRIAAVARGAKRARSTLHSVLNPFQPLAISWFGKQTLRTLHQVEWIGGVRMLTGRALLCGFYLNELLLALLPQEGAISLLFDAYAQAIAALAQSRYPAPILRNFELDLLILLGYAPTLDRTVNDVLIEPEQSYYFRVQYGTLAAAEQPRPDDLLISGTTLLDMRQRRFQQPVTLQESRLLLRAAINALLPARPLKSRELSQYF